MAKVIEHGRFWREERKQAYPDVKIKCPECDNTICMSSYDLYITDPTPELGCICGCKFIPDMSDLVR